MHPGDLHQQGDVLVDEVGGSVAGSTAAAAPYRCAHAMASGRMLCGGSTTVFCVLALYKLIVLIVLFHCSGSRSWV